MKARLLGRAFFRPMEYCLEDHLSFGAVGTHVVVLDLAADRYFRLRSDEAGVLLGMTQSEQHPAIFELLASKGVVSRGAGTPIEPVAAPPPSKSAIETSGCRIRLGAIEVARERLGAAWSLRVRGLHATIKRWRRQKAIVTIRKSGGDDAAAIARGYAAARMLLPAPRLCVPDSLALLRCLWSRGVHADLYFGVRLDPFAAHAWVQRGEIILSDSVGAVSEYQAVFRL